MPLFPREPIQLKTGKTRRSSSRTPVSVLIPTRTWKAEDKCPPKPMDAILDILLEGGRMYQAEIVEAVAERLEVKRGTAASYVSGALLAFAEAGWVECVEARGKRPVWKVVD